MNTIPPSAARFDGVADAYARSRPSYPPEAIAAILAGLPRPADVVDVGAGTGIASRLFVAAGAHVIGLEPSEDMRDAACATGLDVRSASAYETGLADASADLVCAFQAFHWFGDERALAEFVRILRPAGRFAAVWNERDEADPFSDAVRATDMKHGERTMYGDDDLTGDALLQLIERAGFSRARTMTFANAKRYDRDGMAERARGHSFAPRDESGMNAYIADSHRVFDRHRDEDGFAILRFRTEVFLGDLPQ